MKTTTCGHPPGKRVIAGKCSKCYHNSWRANNAEERRASVKKHATKQGAEWRFNRSLMYKHGITIEVYYAMLKLQNNKCATCKTPKPGRNLRFFCVDHDHESGAVRGLLCHYCNLAAGLMKDNADALRELADYVERGGPNVPVRRLRRKVS